MVISNIIKGYFTDKHLANKVLRTLYIEPIVYEFNLLANYTEMLQVFGSADDIPMEFLADLSEELGYVYKNGEDHNVQREIIKRIFSVYKTRASEWSIGRILEYGSDRNFVQGDLTYYHGHMKKRYYEILYPRDKIFTWDKSLWDSDDCFENYFEYNEGVVNFRVSYINKQGEEKLDKDVPAGIRYLIDILLSFELDGAMSACKTLPAYELQLDTLTDIRSKSYDRQNFIVDKDENLVEGPDSVENWFTWDKSIMDGGHVWPGDSLEMSLKHYPDIKDKSPYFFPYPNDAGYYINNFISMVIEPTRHEGTMGFEIKQE